MKELRIEKQIKTAKQKIKLKLWSVDYAKGYCYALLDEDLKNNIITSEDYDNYSEMIDNLAENTTITTSFSDKYKQIINQLSTEEQDELILYDTGVTREELKKIHGYTDEQINYVILTASYKKEFDEFCKKREEERER